VLIVVVFADFPADIDGDLGVAFLAFVRHVLADDFAAVRHPITPHLLRVHAAFVAVALFSIAHGKISDSVSFFAGHRLSGGWLN
jgi:hypothetical protein